MTPLSLPVFALGALGACSPSQGDTGPTPFAVELELSEVIPTVPTVRFQVDGAQSAVVVYGQDGAWDHRVAVDLSGEPPWDMPILGLPPQTSWQLRVDAQTADGPLSSEEVALTTGNGPTGLPSIETATLDPERVVGGWFVTSLVAMSTAVILDEQGRIVWWYQAPDTEMLGRVQLSADGQHVLMGSINLAAAEEVELLRVSLDGTQEERISTPWRHHDFVEHADGTIAYLAHDPREVDGFEVHGDSVMERSPDGELRQVYSVWDHHSPDELVEPAVPFPGATITDWPHANVMDWLPDDQAYLVSFLHLNGIARIDRATGDEQWFLGGVDSTLFDGHGDADWFDGQHGMDLLDDSLLVFVNGYDSGASRVVEMQVDPDLGQAEELWRYSPDPTLYSPTLGDVQRHEGGNILATFSYNGELHQLSADGELLWTLQTGIGGALTYMTWADHLQAE